MRLLIYYPKARGDYYSVLVGRLLMLQSVSQGWGEKRAFIGKVGDDPFGRFDVSDTEYRKLLIHVICLLILNIAPQLWL